MKVHGPEYTVVRNCPTCKGRGWVIQTEGFHAGHPVECPSCKGNPLEIELREQGHRLRKVTGFDARHLIDTGRVRA